MGKEPKPDYARKRSKAAPTRKFITELLVWEGVTIRVKYEASWLSAPEAKTAHLELHVLNPEGAPLPVTDTGYRSHFLTSGAVEDAGGAESYVRAWLDAEAKSPAWRRALDRWRQLSLF